MYKIIFAFLILVSTFSFADTYYLDKDNPNASDSNPGTDPNNPWLTWNKAVNSAQAGDIIIIKKSSAPYIPTENTTFNNNGTANSRIIFRGEIQNDRPVIDYQGSKNFRCEGPNYITWENLEIKNTSDGFYTWGSDYLEVRNCFINGCSSGELIRFVGNHNLLTHSELTGAGHNAVYIESVSDLMSGNGDEPSTGNIIEYNYIHDNPGHHGINIFPRTSDCGALFIDSTIIRGNRIETSQWGMYLRYIRAFQIYDNIIYNNTQGGIMIERAYDSNNSCLPNDVRYGTYDGLGGLVSNNTIYDNDQGSWECAFYDRGASNIRFYNNAIVNSTSDANEVVIFFNYSADDGGTGQPTENTICDNNIIDAGICVWGTSNYSISQWFSATSQTHSLIGNADVSTSGIDSRWNLPGSFLPNNGSPVLDNGFSALPYTDDYYNTQRTQGSGWDIGATELITGPDLIAPEVVSATFVDPITIRIFFSEPLTSSTAQDAGNYSITNGISVLSASLSGSQVTLTTSQHSVGSYTVTVNNVTDLAGNIISPDANSAPYEMIGDVTPPEVNNAVLIDSVTLRITFSEAIDQSTAENTNNYNINPAINILSANLTSSIVTLSTSVHSIGNYTVTVNNVTDLSGNLISPSANSAQYEMFDDSLQGLIQFEIDSATASVIPEPEHSPDQAIDGMGYDDGDPDSRWAGDTMPEWIMFDLGTIKQVSLVRLAFYSWETGRIYNYTIKVSTDLINWDDVLTNVSSAEAEWTENQFNVVDARYIRIVFISSNQNGWAGLWEGQIWGYDDPLAVELTEFSGQSDGENTTLNWKTSTELNNEGFQIERKTSDEFIPVGYINGQGTSPEEHSYTFTDSSLTSGKYFYRLKMIEFGGAFEYSDEISVDVTLPEHFILEQNFPNPFNPSTTIKFSLPQRSEVKLTIYNLLGEIIENLVNEELNAGVYSFEFSPDNLSSGVYLYAIESNDYKEIKKMVFLK